ncbi:titin homolog isoform X2 [Epinephelus moara]|uniref:titin homolog isoform X2 n=1 Tax=Epinephelus moara TaxID=300413 RepID=UPI00214E12A6|nr:titin homolog isoform X2 [Epinephelus moara]
MSAQSAKKKRFGSRRRAANQNEISRGDEFHTTDSTFVAQYHIPEENTESLNEVASPDNSQSETQPLPSPELSGNRRKLGSSRRNKRQHVKDSETESHHNPREEVEEKTRGEETTETKQMSLVIQHKRQEELSQGAVDNMSATHDESLYSAVTPHHPSEVQNSSINYAEADLESLIPKSENLQVDQDENETNSRVVSDSCKLVEYMQEGNDKSDTLHSEDVKESEHLLGISELSSLSVLSCPTVDPQLIDQLNSREMPEEKFPNMYSTTEKDSNERDDNTELLKQHGNLQGNFLVSESHVESVAMQFSTTPVITTEKMSSRENTDTECRVWQAAISTAEEVLHTDEEQNEHFNLSEVRGDHQSEDAENKVHEQKIKPTEIHEITSEMLIHDATENPEIISENLTDQTDMSGTQQPEFVVKITDDCLTSNEISSSDSKQDEHHTDESNAEALEEKNEDYHVYHTKKPPISDIERVDTVLGQVYEMEGQVEDDIKPSVEQTGHQEKDRLFYEMEESESPLRTLKSEINSPFDSEHQQDDTGFNPLGNRRKLGSSRRNKGRQHVKDPDAESYHQAAEDVVGNTRDNEPLETTEMSLTIKTAMQGKTNETMLEGIDKFDTAETEDVGDQVKENALCTDIHSSSTVDQQTIDQSNIRKLPDEELPSSCSVTERDENTELLEQWGILQSNDLVSEGVESSIASEITTDNHDPKEHTEPECSVEQALFSLPIERLPTNEEQNEHFNLSEVRGDHQSEDAESKVHEQEIKPTEMPQTEHSSEMLIHDATENPEITSGNLTDQTEVSDTHQSDLILKSVNASPTNQEISNPDDKEDEHHTEESNVEPLEQKNEDYHVYDTKKAPISDIERADTALGQVSEVEGQVEDDVKPSDEQTDHQEKEGLFSEIEESESSLQTLQSEVNSPFDSQHHTRDNEPLETTEMSLTTETAVQEKTNETMLEGTDKFNTAETEDVSDQVKENEHGGTHIGTDVPLSSTVDQQTIDQSNIREMPDDELTNVCSVTERKERDENTELLKQWGILQSNDLMSEDVESSITSEITTDKHDPREHTEPEYSVEQAIFSLPKEESPTNEEQNEHFNLSEVSGDHQSEDAESKVHEQEIKPTEMLQTEHSSEMLIHDATENPEITSENLTDQTEVSDTHQSEWVAKSANDSPLKQDISNPDNQQDEHLTKESNFEVLEQKKEDNHAYDIKTPPISSIERVDTALSQVYEMEGQLEDDIKPSDEQTGHQKKGGLFSEMEESESSLQTLQSGTNARFDSQHQQSDTGFNPLGNRRKLGSSRRNRGRRHVKDSDAESPHTPTEDVVGNTRDNEPLETTEMSLTIETAMQGETNETMLEGIDKFDTAETEDVSDQVKENKLVGTDLLSSSTVDQQTIDQSNIRKIPDEELPSSCSVTESKERDENTELLKQWGILQSNDLVSEGVESSVASEITTDKHDPKEHTEPECGVEQALFSLPKEELPTNEEQNEHFNLSEVSGDHQSQDAESKVHEQEIKPTEMPQTEHSSEMLIHDATENPEITSGNLIDQTEVSDTHQSDLILKSVNASPTNQEISNPDDKEDEHHTEESNVEPLEQKNEDYHVYDTKKAPISDIERADTALGQVSEVEGQVEDDVKPSDEQTDHQEKEGLFSEIEESESSLQTLQSEVNSPFDSQHQQDDTGFNPLGNRRKLGSSRRNRGRRHVKDPDAESYHEPTEDVVGNTRDNEPLETTEMSLTTETAMQEKTSETMLEGIDKFDTTDAEDVSDQVKEKEHVVTLVGTDLHSSSTVDQQTIDQSNIREMPDEELPSSCSVTEKEMDEDTELLGQSGILQSNNLVSEDVESSITSEITTDKHDPREHTEPEYSVEQAIFSLLKEELPTNEEQNEHFNLSEVSGDHQSQDAESKVHEQEIEPTEMPQTEYSSEMLIHDAIENPEIISENLTDQTEVSDAHQSELSVNSADDSPFKQEILDPNDKEDEHHTEESNFETSEQKHEEYNVYDTKTPPISNIERVDTVLGQVYEMGCRVEDDIKSSDEQTGHQEKEAVFSEMEASESSLQTLQSEINSPFDSQHQQNETGLNPLGNRKKLGSSRRNKGRRHVKDSHTESHHTPSEDVVGNTRDNEPLETTEMSLTTETAMQGKTNETMLEGIDKFDTAETEDVGDQVKENALGTDIHSSSTEDQQTIDQLIFREMPDKELPDVRSVPEKESKDRDEDTELLRHDGNLQTNRLVSELHENSADLESSITSEITTDKHNPREHTEPEVRGDHQSENAVNIVDGQEVKQTQMLEMPQIEQSSERLIHDTTENLKITSGDLTDQTEVSDTHQSELIMRSANDSSTNQEILNPDEKQDEHHTKESNTEALEQINEDYHVYDTKTPPISDVERVDTAFGQVYEMEGQLEDDMKPSVEQTGHQEREGVFSEMEESESSLQTQQSDINARFDSQHQQNDTGFNPLGNRRKLGSSRRNRGRRHVKDPDAESYHEPTEDVVGNTRHNEPLEKTEMSLTIETAVQEKTNETMLEGIDKFDTTEAEDVSDQVKENDHVVTLVGTDLHSSSTVDQQTIDQSNVREIPDEELPSSCSVTEKESKETDKDTELLKQSGILQTNYLLGEPHVKSRALESSITSEITTDNLSSREHTEPEVRGDPQSEDAESHMHEQEIKPAEIHEIMSEMLIHDATENPENLTDQTDMSGTQQSEFIVKITNDFLTSNEISSSDDKQDEHHMKESNAEALEQKNEDYHVYDTKKATISDIERVDTALGQVSEVEGQVEDDVKPSDEQTDHQEKEGLFDKMEESESSLQTLQSETNVPFDSQHQQSDTGFNPLGNRRKLGSSRRNRGRRHVKDPDAESHHTPTEDVVGNTRDNEPLETTEMSLTIETAMQGETNETMLEGTDKFSTAETEDVSDQVKENEHGGTLVSTDLHSSSTVDQQTIDQSNREMPDEELPSSCSVTDKESKETDEDTELLKQSGILQSNDLVSEPHVKSRALESSITSEITTDKHDSREHTEPEVSDHQSEDAESKVHEQEIKPTEMPQTEHSSERLIHGATENPEITSGNLIDHTEVSDTHQSEWVVKSTYDSPFKQDISNPNDTERVDTALGHMYEMEDRVEDDIKPSVKQTDHQEKQGVFSEMEESESALQTQQSEVNAPFDSQHQQSDTGFNPLGNRRKLGSSRRNRGRRHVKDSDAESHHTPTEDVVGNTRDNEPLETSLTIETAVQEKTNETMLEGIDKFDTAETEDVSDQVKDNEHVVTLVGTDVHSSSTVDQQTMGQLNFREMPDKELPNVCSAPEIESKDRDEDTGLLRQDGNLQTNFLVSESRVESADLESSITPEITTDKHSQRKHTEIECIVEQAVFSSSKDDLSTDEEHKEPKVRGAHHLQDAVNEEEVKSTQVQEMHQIDNSSVMEIESSLQTLQSEMNTPLDSHPLDNSQSIKEQTHTGFSSTGNRRKLGSSRRNKGRLHVEDTTKISLVTETTRQEELKEQTGLDFKSAGEMRKIRSAVNDGENTDKIFAEDTLLSQNVMDNSTNLTTDIASSSGKHDVVKSNKEVSDEENKLMKESDHLNQLTGCDTVKTDLIQSPEVSVWKDDADIQSISYHDDSVTARLIASDALEQEEAFHVQNTEALPSDKEISMQKTNDTLETVRDVIIKDLSTGEEGAMYVQGSGQDEDGEQFEDSMKKDHKDREINVELFSAEHSKTDTPSDIGLEEKLRAEPAVDVSEESGISSKQEKTHLDGSETLQVEPKQRRRKMGSTRRSQLNRKPEEKRTETIDSDFNTEADMKNLDKRGVVEELPVTVAAEVSPSEKAKPSLSPASHNEEAVDPVKFVQVADVRERERNVDVSVEPSQIDDFTAIEVDIASVLAGDNSINPLLSANTEDTTEESFVSLCETTQSAQNDEDRPESVSVTNNQALKSAEQSDVAVLDIVKSEVRGGTGEEHLSAQASEEEPDNMNEGAHNKNPEGKNRRRKLGSSRRNLPLRTKREDLHQKQEVDDEATEAATNVGDVKTESLSGIIEDEEQLHVADKDIGSKERKETVFETEEHGHTGESQENPVSGGQLVETEHQPTPNDPSAIPSSSPKQDSVSELTSSGKRRKMGSHRKSHGHQNNENQTAGGDRITDTQNGQDVRGTRDQSAIKTTEELREKSLGLGKIPEVDESDKTPSSNISTSKEGEHSRPVSDKTPQPVTPIQHRSADICLGQESQTKFSLGNARAADLRSNAYNVMMIGDSSVGKTSFIKRAQSGKFSLDLPASVGLDSCMWTVVVEGKPVVLQLWDTAGQERFHSITRQIFHKAQAFLLMYDITCSQSFSAVSYWASCIQEGAAEDVMVLLVGNKSDCAKRQVKTQEAESLAKEYNFEFMECSAATGENVVQSLETVARMLSQRDDTREEAMVLHKEPQKKKSSGCC